MSTLELTHDNRSIAAEAIICTALLLEVWPRVGLLGEGAQQGNVTGCCDKETVCVDR